MKFADLLESNMLTELSKDGRWVTFKNKRRAYVSKSGKIETGVLKGLNLKNKKGIKKRFEKLKSQRG